MSASLPRCASLQSVPVKLITDIVTLKNKFHGLLVHFDIGKEYKKIQRESGVCC